jgi:hypothetical protein
MQEVFSLYEFGIFFRVGQAKRDDFFEGVKKSIGVSELKV